MTREVPNLLSMERPGQEDLAHRWSRALAPLNREEMLLGTGERGSTVGLFPPGALSRVDEDPSERHRWRVATWHETDDPDLGHPDEVRVVDLETVLGWTGEPWRPWALKRTATHLHRLDASGRDPWSGEMVGEDLQTFSDAARLLRQDASEALPNADWNRPVGPRRGGVWLRLCRRLFGGWREPTVGDPDVVGITDKSVPDALGARLFGLHRRHRRHGL
jgi:hypothetical protein